MEGEFKPEKDIKYWMFQPGRGAEHWDEFYEKVILLSVWAAWGTSVSFKVKMR